MVVFLYFGGYFYLFTSKSTIFSMQIMLFLCFMFFIFVTTLKYHSNKFLELKPKDEVTLLSHGVLFWFILECSKLHFSPFISMGAHF